VPIDPILTTSTERGQAFIDSLKNSSAFAKFKEITEKLIGHDTD